ncbi:MAG: stage II sporulation protein M [Chitinophagaceae bacterium]
MREALFIKKNADKWQEHQHQPTDDPDEQAERFITILDDLAYSKTFYPQSKVTRWINGIAAGTYQKIYQNKKEKYSRLGSFWKTELPMVMYKHRNVLYFTFGLFLLFVGLAVWSSIQDFNFMRNLMPGLVERTEKGIEDKDPFGYYRDNDKFTMFAQITFNNILVSFIPFAGGITFGLVTTWNLFNNSMMLGVFQYMHFAQGIGWESVLVIWIHGAIEIPSFVLAAMSGYIVAKGLLFKGTFSWKDSLMRSMKDAIKLIIALIPLFCIAGFFESNVTYLSSNAFDNTANTSLPVWASILILVSSLSFMVWYFAIYPLKVAKTQAALMADALPQLMTA